MRVFLIALMIALLPLRGWVGDAMAVQMLPQTMPVSVNATNSVASEQGVVRTSGSFDSEMTASDHANCPGHAAAASGGQDGASGADSGCTSCQLCHLLAWVDGGIAPAATALPQVAPTRTVAALHSAEAASSLKPPIS